MTESTQGKGRPTPKRSDAQKRRGGPVAPPPTNRREAAKQQRTKQAEDRGHLRKGSADDSRMLARDQGPVRRHVRDFVDGRRGLAFLLLPVAAFLVVAQILSDPVLVAVAVGIWFATLLGVAADLLLMGIRLRKSVVANFPNEAKVGSHVRYGLLRSTVFRRLRMPKPQVKPGKRSSLR